VYVIVFVVRSLPAKRSLIRQLSPAHRDTILKCLNGDVTPQPTVTPSPNLVVPALDVPVPLLGEIVNSVLSHIQAEISPTLAADSTIPHVLDNMRLIISTLFQDNIKLTTKQALLEKEIDEWKKKNELLLLAQTTANEVAMTNQTLMQKEIDELKEKNEILLYNNEQYTSHFQILSNEMTVDDDPSLPPLIENSECSNIINESIQNTSLNISITNSTSLSTITPPTTTFKPYSTYVRRQAFFKHIYDLSHEQRVQFGIDECNSFEELCRNFDNHLETTTLPSEYKWLNDFKTSKAHRKSIKTQLKRHGYVLQTNIMGQKKIKLLHIHLLTKPIR
jgi:hypothetical protein